MTNDLGLLSKTNRFLFNNFEMKDMDKTYYVIRIEVFSDRAQKLLGLSQKTY